MKSKLECDEEEGEEYMLKRKYKMYSLQMDLTNHSLRMQTKGQEQASLLADI